MEARNFFSEGNYKLFCWVLLINGITLIECPRGLLRQVIANCGALLFVAYNYFRLFYYFLHVKLGPENFYTVVSLHFYVTQLLVQHILAYRTLAIRNYIVQVLKPLSSKEKRQVLQSSAKYIPAFWIALYLSNIVERGVMWSEMGNAKYLESYVKGIVVINCSESCKGLVDLVLSFLYIPFVPNWFCLAPMMIAFLLSLLQETNCQMLDNLINKRIKRPDLQSIRLLLREKLHLKEQFERLAITFIGLWVPWIFSYCTSMIFRMNFGAYGTKASLAMTGTAFLRFGYYFWAVFSIVFVNSYYNDQLRLKVDVVIEKLIQGSRNSVGYHERETLIAELEEVSLEIELSAWKMVSFDQQFLLPFLNSVISSSVLFLEAIRSY